MPSRAREDGNTRGQGAGWGRLGLVIVRSRARPRRDRTSAPVRGIGASADGHCSSRRRQRSLEGVGWDLAGIVGFGPDVDRMGAEGLCFAGAPGPTPGAPPHQADDEPATSARTVADGPVGPRARAPAGCTGEHHSSGRDHRGHRVPRSHAVGAWRRGSRWPREESKDMPPRPEVADGKRVAPNVPAMRRAMAPNAWTCASLALLSDAGGGT
jgi:hypothetical protein